MTLADPSTPELGPLTTSVLLDRVWSNVKALPVSIGQAVSGWAAPRRVALPLAFLVLIGMASAGEAQAVSDADVRRSVARGGLPDAISEAIRSLSDAALSVLRACALSAAREARAGAGIFGRRSFPVLRGRSRSGSSSPSWGIRNSTISASSMGSTITTLPTSSVGQLVEYKLFYYAPVGTAFDQALDWLQIAAERTDVIAATDPQWVYLRTGRKAVLPPFESNGKTAQRLIDTVPVKYLIVESKPERLGWARTTDSLRPCCARTLLRGIVSGAAPRAVSRSTSEPVQDDSRRTARPYRMTVQARLAAAFRCRRIVFCLLVGVAALASWAPRGGGPIDLRWDGGAYYVLGTSLAEVTATACAASPAACRAACAYRSSPPSSHSTSSRFRPLIRSSSAVRSKCRSRFAPPHMQSR